MTPADLIDIYGADTAHWPDEDRAAALAAIAADPALQAKLAEARALDTMLDEWASRTPARADAEVLAARILRPAARWPRIVGAGGLAAAAVAAIVLITMPSVTPGSVTTVAATAEVEAADDADFAELFTPTPDEESLT